MSHSGQVSSRFDNVIKQSGHAKPRSVTADEAKKRAAALSCSKEGGAVNQSRPPGVGVHVDTATVH